MWPTVGSPAVVVGELASRARFLSGREFPAVGTAVTVSRVVVRDYGPEDWRVPFMVSAFDAFGTTYLLDVDDIAPGIDVEPEPPAAEAPFWRDEWAAEQHPHGGPVTAPQEFKAGDHVKITRQGREFWGILVRRWSYHRDMWVVAIAGVMTGWDGSGGLTLASEGSLSYE